jgi:hypothetical protein
MNSKMNSDVPDLYVFAKWFGDVRHIGLDLLYFILYITLTQEKIQNT